MAIHISKVLNLERFLDIRHFESIYLVVLKQSYNVYWNKKVLEPN